jgi:hypothetical protein
MCIIALIQVFYLVVRKKYTSLVLFCIIGVMLNLFIKNISIVLILDIIITNILMKTVKREGFEDKPATPETGDTGTKETKQPEPSETKPTKKTSDIETSTPSKIESFDNHDEKIKKVNNSILMLSNLLDKFAGISSKLGFQ